MPSPVKYALGLAAVVLALAACDDPYDFTPDLTTVPARFDTTAAIRKEVRPGGLRVYTISEGTGLDRITEMDQVLLFYTLRLMDSTIVQSTWANSGISPDRFNLPNTIAGFRNGLAGARAGDRLVIVIPPELGYGNSPTSTLRDQTLWYDIEVTEVID